MRSATLLVLGSSLTAVFVMMACASTEEIPAQLDDQPVDAGTKGSTTKLPEASSDDSEDLPEPPKKVCVAKCSANTECQNSCPKSNSGVYCCDAPTTTCYLNGTSTCPSSTDGGDPPPSY